MPREKKIPKSDPDPADTIGGLPSFEERFLKPRASGTSRNLKVLRAITRLTSKRLAELSGLSHSLIRAVENEHRMLHVGGGLVIAFSTGVDPFSLLFGKTLLEWGGAAPYTEDTFKAWIERDKNPTPEQESNGHRQLRNLCRHACEELGAGHIGDAILSTYLHILIGGVDDEIQYEGIKP